MREASLKRQKTGLTANSFLVVCCLDDGFENRIASGVGGRGEWNARSRSFARKLVLSEDREKKVK